MLYPINTALRTVIDLSGTWKFMLEPETGGVDPAQPLRTDRYMAVPASFNDQGIVKSIRRHVGKVYYEKEFTIMQALQSQRLVLRFGSATHTAVVYLNGMEVVRHKGGFTPFEAEINRYLVSGKNRLLVEVSNIIDHTTLPVGNFSEVRDGSGNVKKRLHENFDFFNYAGLHRPVKIYTTPAMYIKDITVSYTVDSGNAAVRILVDRTQDAAVALTLYDETGMEIARSEGADATLLIPNVTLWEPLKPYHYTVKVELKEDGKTVDVYEEAFGVRTIEIKNARFFINDKAFYFKGFGKHEDIYYNGRGLNEAANVMDINLMKWLGANSFRTSHYPYSEEMMRLADRQGIVVIDETTAVGLMPQFSPDLILTGTAAKPENPWKIFKTQEAHEQVIRELIARDKNLACVVMWSIANEAATYETGAVEYFKSLLDLMRRLDPQKRPLTMAYIMHATPETDLTAEYLDVICLNRYYGWYVNHQDLEGAETAFKAELQGWVKRCPNTPIIMTEYGADTIPGLHAIDDIPYTEEYQSAYYEMNHRVFDSCPNIAGEQLWNFADFETWTGLIRVQGNHKGIFSRNREPKAAAKVLKERWDSIPCFGYKT